MYTEDHLKLTFVRLYLLLEFLNSTSPRMVVLGVDNLFILIILIIKRKAYMKNMNVVNVHVSI